MDRRQICLAIVLAGLVLPLWGALNPGRSEDQIDAMLRSGRVPKDLIHEHGYSDFTDPIGRFMDVLAAGAFAEARTLQPAACAAWLAVGQNSPLTGKFWAFDTEIDLNTLCAARR